MLKEQLANFLTSYQINNQRIAVAVSGGVDSLSLALLILECMVDFQLEIICLVVNHNLRVEANAEARHTVELLERYGLKAEILEWKHDVSGAPSSNIMKKARDERYRLIVEFCNLNGINSLFIAHHADDNAETVLQRIYRGSGILGLCAINAKSKRCGIYLYRPLLNVRKKQLVDYLNGKGVVWIEDRSNDNTRYERVKIRKAMDAFENKDVLVMRLNLLASNALRVEKCLSNLTKAGLKETVRFCEPGYAVIDTAKFAMLEEEIALRVLVKIILKIRGEGWQHRLSSLLRIYSHIANNTQIARTYAGCEFRRHKVGFLIFRESKGHSTRISDEVRSRYPDIPLVKILRTVSL